jgi:hypothetical protein
MATKLLAVCKVSTFQAILRKPFIPSRASKDCVSFTASEINLPNHFVRNDCAQSSRNRVKITGGPKVRMINANFVDV